MRAAKEEHQPGSFCVQFKRWPRRSAVTLADHGF
jgi:hypothetical protein